MYAHEYFEQVAHAGDLDALLQKEALNLSGFGKALKDIALKDVGGPKGFLQPASEIARGSGRPPAGKVLPAARKLAPAGSKRTAGGAWDLSAEAQRMGIT